MRRNANNISLLGIVVLTCVFSLIISNPVYAVKEVDSKQAAKSKRVLPGEAEGFNPQPEPPGRQMMAKPETSGKPIHPALVKGFNPQPDPPRTLVPAVQPGEAGEEKAGGPIVFQPAAKKAKKAVQAQQGY